MIRRRRVLVWFAVPAFAVGLACAVWWCVPGENLGRWRSGPAPEPWASWIRQDELWRSEGLTREIEHEYVPLSQISVELQLAALVSEDIEFFDHGGVDPRAILEALVEWRRGARLRGASTITQQLARTLFLSPTRSLGRKLREIRLAWWMERRLGKRRILELYLNVVEFGPGLFGAQAASCSYYELAADSLTPEAAAGLVSAIPSPGRDNPRSATKRWEFRRETILRRMQHAEWLREKLLALQEPEDGNRH